MVYGYARVSTKSQARDGHSLEAQETVLKENGAKIVFSDAYTGTKNERPELDDLLELLQAGDTLIVTKLDRIARSLSDGARLVDDLLKRDIKVNILNIGIMDNTPMSKMIRHIFFSISEFERDMIIERTQEGKAIARTKAGYREGRKKVYTDEQLRHALQLLNEHSYKEVERMTKISISTLQRAKRASAV